MTRGAANAACLTACALLLLNGCGLKGDLYLDDKETTTGEQADRSRSSEWLERIREVGRDDEPDADDATGAAAEASAGASAEEDAQAADTPPVAGESADIATPESDDETRQRPAPADPLP